MHVQTMMHVLPKVLRTPKRHAKRSPLITSVLYSPHYALLRYPSHTHQNNSITAPKNPSQAFHPTPVFCAILNIRFMVPFILFREFSN